MIALLFFLIVAFFASFVVIGISISAPVYKGPTTDHFDGKKFLNPTGIQAKGLKEVFKWATNRKRGEWKPNLSERYGPRPLERETENIRVTFVNHSTFLIQVDGVNILTDPVWSTRTSPFSWAGPKRMRLPGIKLEQLPKIHIVLLSHNHYDHLDIMTMRTIFGAHHPKIVVPLGVKRFLEENWIGGSVEMDWWQEDSLVSDVRIQSVPAQHFSGRGMLDRDKTLWCGYVLKTTKGNIYFAGDTGYNESTFKEIGDKAGPFKLSLLPIGAYQPRWFMSPIHTSPDEAVRIHMDVKSELSIGSHFGTFPLADEGLDEPKQDLRRALGLNNISLEKFITLEEGQPFIVQHG
jgi:L-ascorbate metabolism protein UlaG (beta-lactamase superfamily)